MKQNIFFTLLLFLITTTTFATTEEKNKSTNSFKSIRSILVNDGLNEEAEKNKTKERRVDAEKKLRIIKRYSIPGQDKIWSFLSEYWLIKNGPVIRWDFKKPDYGLNTSFATFLEKINIPEQKFKILLVNTTALTHFALPANKDELILLLSIPFIRSMDLTKIEISILLFEDVLRIQDRYFVEHVKTKELTDILGGNFHKNKLNKIVLDKVIKRYDTIIFDKGFTFQQQFHTTMKIKRMLKQDPALLSAYKKLLIKISDLIKTEDEYKQYSKIYPSPEMQLKWIEPKKKVL